jgi:hypothetical protein
VVAEIFPVDVPPVRENTTLLPPVVNVFPAVSWAVRVNAVVVPEAKVVVPTAMVELASDIGPGTTVRLAVPVILLPEIVALIVVAVPERIPVKVLV